MWCVEDAGDVGAVSDEAVVASSECGGFDLVGCVDVEWAFVAVDVVAHQNALSALVWCPGRLRSRSVALLKSCSAAVTASFSLVYISDDWATVLWLPLLMATQYQRCGLLNGQRVLDWRMWMVTMLVTGRSPVP